MRIQRANDVEEQLLLLAYTSPATGYWLSQAVRRGWPGKVILETDDRDIDLDTFLEREPCEVVVHPAPHPVVVTSWDGPDEGLKDEFKHGYRTVTWRGTAFEVVDAQWPSGWDVAHRRFIIGPSEQAVRAFATQIAEVANRVEDEVLVFSDGCWQRDESLREAIRSATFENLVLPGDLGPALLASCQHFLAAREDYARFGIPWKRGVLLLGPPGNGKTHCIKALLNALDLPCLYVQSFASRYGNPQANVKQVFERARRTTPCALVLEDLDSLLTDETRSFFLNELDGFALNEGILTLASTNHPDKLDPAIVHRPSRFDRKVHFDLPQRPERVRYLQQLNARMGAELPNETIEELGTATADFSFAYVKELMLASVTEWIGVDRQRPLGDIARGQVEALRAQLASAKDARPST